MHPENEKRELINLKAYRLDLDYAEQVRYKKGK
jgi:hypothetical protein